jgi:hypothetical protein
MAISSQGYQQQSQAMQQQTLEFHLQQQKQDQENDQATRAMESFKTLLQKAGQV